MALTPVAFTKNWKDTFGSQYVPTDAGAAAASFIAAPAITSLTSNATGLVTMVATRAGAGRVDWGDGLEEALAATGNVTHQYTRRGDFAVKIWTTADPNNWTSKRVRVTVGA